MSDFSDRPFALGSLTGLRSFNVDQYGRLQATQLKVVWTPGENTGRCLKDLFPPSTLSIYASLIAYDPFGGSKPLEPTKPEVPKGHRVGTLGCSCGFYAYFDNGPNRYKSADRLSGLIEGYGVVTVGERGFRAEKARIQALIIKPGKVNDRTALVRANYPDVPIFESKADALAEFPLTPPALPTPTSDSDFWTREAL